MEKPAFQQIVSLRVKVVYCILVAGALIITAALDFVNQEFDLAWSAACFSFILILYSIYLIFKRRRRTPLYVEWILTILLGLFTIIGMHQKLYIIQWIYFFPIYVFFVFSFRLANFIILIYSGIIFLIVLNYLDTHIRLQLLFTYSVCYAFSLTYALVNEHNKMLLSNLINTDPLTQIYNKHQLLHDLKKEISRADRQRKGLVLMTIKIPSSWQPLRTEEYENRLANVGHRIQRNIRNFDTCYRLSGDDFVILMPNSTKSDADELNDILHVNLSKDHHAPSNNFLVKTVIYQSDDDHHSLLRRATSNLERNS